MSRKLVTIQPAGPRNAEGTCHPPGLPAEDHCAPDDEVQAVCGALRAPHTAGKRPTACGGGLREAAGGPKARSLREAVPAAPA
jgi:hypothetical protein